MICISDIKDLKGETIKNAIWLDYNETLGLLFTDDTYCSVDVDFFCDSHELKLNDPGDLPDYQLRNLGVISQSELEKRTAERLRKQIEEQEDRERAQYERLKARFDDQ